MKPILLYSLLASFTSSLAVNAHKNFTIHGRIELHSVSKAVIVSGSFGQYAGTINNDGSFVIKGAVTEAGTAFIKTDSSSTDAIWLEPGEYQIVCKEISIPGLKGYYFRTPSLKGPSDAEIYNRFSQPMYYVKGKTSDERKQYYKNHFTGYIDSIFKVNPTSAALPEMIRFSAGFIGDEAAAFFHSLLSAEQKIDSSSRQLDYYFKRKEKIAAEKVFQDFRMMDQYQKLFNLSSLNKKLILIDFWSSDCYPCRKKHEKLVELYKKYGSKGLEIVSISLDNNDKAWRKAIEKDNMTWINVSELRGWNTGIAEAYFVKSLPFSLWLDKDKKILGEELTEKEIEAHLK